MRKALIVGLDEYDNASIENLKCAKSDARSMYQLLSNHYVEDGVGEPNFSCELLVSSTDSCKNKVTRPVLQRYIKELFEDEEADIALFYFSGHGFLGSLGGYLVTQDADAYEEGISFNDIMIYANNSSIKEIVLILDCCQSGNLGNTATSKTDSVFLRKGISILTSSNAAQLSFEQNGNGVFTRIVLNALEGGSSDILGNVTVAHIYQLADAMLGPWDQRPLMKTNSSRLSVIRKAKPKIDRTILVRMLDHFKGEDYFLHLDPSFEENLEPRNDKNEKVMKDLRAYYHQGLVVPLGVKYMYEAAKNSTGCELTPLGKEYWKLLKKEMI